MPNVEGDNRCITAGFPSQHATGSPISILHAAEPVPNPHPRAGATRGPGRGIIVEERRISQTANSTCRCAECIIIHLAPCYAPARPNRHDHPDPRHSAKQPPPKPLRGVWGVIVHIMFVHVICCTCWLVLITSTGQLDMYRRYFIHVIQT